MLIQTIEQYGPGAALINPNLIVGHRDIRQKQGELADELFGFIYHGLPFVESQTYDNGRIEFGDTRRIRANDLYSNNGRGGIIAETYAWIEASKHFFGNYMDWEVSKMWQAFFDQRLIDERPLNQPMAKARLLTGMVGGRGYQLIQTTDDIFLTLLPNGGALRMADIVIAPTCKDNPEVLPIPRLVKTTSNTPTVVTETIRRETVINEWTQVSPLSPHSENICIEEALRHRQLHDAMAKAVIGSHEMMIWRGGQILLGENLVQLLKITDFERIGESRRTITRKSDGHIYTADEIAAGYKMNTVNKYRIETDIIHREVVTRDGVLTEFNANGVPIDLMRLITSGIVTPIDLVVVDGKETIMGELVQAQSVKLMQQVAEGSEKIAVAARILAGYLVRGPLSLNYRNNKLTAGMAEAMLQVITQTWPVAYLMYVDKYYLTPIANFLKGQENNPEMVVCRR